MPEKNPIQKFNDPFAPVKSLFVPLLTTSLLIISFFLPNFSYRYIPFEKLSLNLSSSSDRWFLAASLFLPVFMIVSVLYFGNSWRRHHEDRFLRISFVNQWTNRHYLKIFMLFPMTLLFEELVFRGILHYLLAETFGMWTYALLNAGIFALYHFHIYLSSRDLFLTSLFIYASGLLGWWLAIVFPYVGLIGVWGLHLLSVTLLYMGWILNHQKGRKKSASIKM